MPTSLRVPGRTPGGLSRVTRDKTQRAVKPTLTSRNAKSCEPEGQQDTRRNNCHMSRGGASSEWDAAAEPRCVNRSPTAVVASLLADVRFRQGFAGTRLCQTLGLRGRTPAATGDASTA